MDKITYLKIYFPNGSFHALRYTSSTKISDLIRIVLKGRLSPYEILYHLSFAIRIAYVGKEHNQELTNQTHLIYKWLHSNMTMDNVQNLYGPTDELKFELRLRYLPQTIDDLANDKATLGFFYEQLRIDYMRFKAEYVSMNEAIELGSLEIRKLFKDLNSTALDKKVNMDYLEKELGLRKFFPQTLIDSNKSRVLRKYIKTCLKKYEGLHEDECVKRFCSLLKNVWNWDQEIFICHLGTEWAVPIHLVIGPSDGISYRTQNSPTLTKMTLFENILTISTTKTNNDDRGLLKLVIAGSSEALIFSFPTLTEANEVAILIDGYCMFGNRSYKSIWQNMVDEQNSLPKEASLTPTITSDFTFKNNQSNGIDDDDDGDYADVLSSDYEIDRKNIQMIESLGNGQFGEVYRGILKTDRQLEINIAIKTCKMQDSATTGAFLDEAYVMQKFNHPHIIKLIGVCMDQPVLLIIELARLGELRTYLVNHRLEFDVITLISYCQQISSALAYLESKKFVHRDIAARNVLVSTHEIVKLADFGLSRQLTLDNSYYKASKGKLPIKWMAPESINFRRFTHLSDVWMFAVCMWEILTMGKKPFQGTPNTEVIDQIENGVRLPLPGVYCPKCLYDLLQECWSYEPTNRPNFIHIEERLKSILNIQTTEQNFTALSISTSPSATTTINLSPSRSNKNIFLSNRSQISHMNLILNKDDSSHSRLNNTDNEQKLVLHLPTSTNEKYVKLSKIKDQNSTRSTLLIDLFHSQTKQIINSVLILTKKRDIDCDSGISLTNNRSTSPINEKEQMQLVRDVAIAVRDLLQTLDYAPMSIKEMCEQRYKHFSDIVVALIETVRERNYDKMYEHAVDIARTAQSLFDDIKKLS